jgi:hypothetical protein
MLSSPTPAAMERRSQLIKLDSNENPFGPSARAVEAMRSALSAANSYPDDDCGELRRKLATHHEVPPEQVLVGAGSTAIAEPALPDAARAGTECGDQRALVHYLLDGRAGSAGQLIETPMRDDSFDLEAILSAIDAKTRIVFLANPNNPTGTMLEAAVVERFLAQFLAMWSWCWMRLTTNSRCTSRRCGSYLLELAGICSPRFERGGAANIFEGARARRSARGYGLGPAELLGYCARMRNTFSVSSVATSGGIGSARRLQSHSACGGEQCSCSPEFSPRDCRGWDIASFPPRRIFSSAIWEKTHRPSLHRLLERRSGRASAGALGRAELHSRDDWDGGAESGVSARRREWWRRLGERRTPVNDQVGRCNQAGADA